jgi:solute carrier family 39 (zinc transporter), member 1/2/3
MILCGSYIQVGLFLYKYSFAALILLSTILAGVIPFIKRHKSCCDHGPEFPIGEAIACGVFLGAGLIHMLSDASASFHELNYDYPFASFLAGVSFLFMLSLEHICRELREKSGLQSNWVVWIAALMLSIHSLLAGAALGLATNLSSISLIFIAIIVHKWAESFSLAVEVNKASLGLQARWMVFLIFALMTPLGVFLGTQVSSEAALGGLWEAIFTALSAGTFIYIGTLHGLTQSAMIQRCCNLREFVFVIFGFLLMAIVASWF